ncbi:hypothetical protein BGZ90_002543 [Linnemannia elongata]|nr:hypothetical protein BGZ90_002543 [Linnemannia elongata]
MDAAAQQGFGEILSHVIGWAYFIAWSASFYPQAILNWRRKSVQGLSMDFIYLNVLGFLCYSIFNLSFYYSPEVQEEYRKRNDGQDNLVRANDVFFAVHALILSSFTLFQTLIYKWIDVLYYLSYIKLGISFIKYCPQVYLNYASQSTVGWSIHNILLDFTGGALSIGQLVLDAYISGDWSGISGDPVKFGLGFLSIAFDLIFMTQHFILYRNREDFYAPLSMVENNGEAHESKKLLLSPGHRTYSSIQREDARVSRPASMKDLELGFDDSQHSTRH